MLGERLNIVFDQSKIIETFHQQSSTDSPPTEHIPFYVKKDGEVMEISKDYQKEIRFGEFAPWDRDQIWVYFRDQDFKGWLVNLGTREFVGYRNHQFIAKRSYSCTDEEKDLFDFTNEWTHLSSGKKISGEIIPIPNFIRDLARNNICWPNTVSNSESPTFWPSLW